LPAAWIERDPSGAQLSQTAPPIRGMLAA